MPLSSVFRSIACLILVACCALAQQKLTLKDAIHEALGRHPSVAIAGHRLAASEAMVRQAGAKPNPRAYVQIENLRAWGQPDFSYSNATDNFFYLSQVFETAHKRDRRVDLAQSNVRLANLDQQIAIREVVSRVAAAYWNMAGLTLLRDLLREDLRTFESTVQYHRDRVQQGAMAEVDLLRVLVERDRLAVGVSNANQEAAMAMLSLVREIGRPNLEAIELSDTLPAVSIIPPPDFDRALAAHPAMIAARAAVQRTAANLNLQQAIAKPDPEVLFGYKRTAGFDTLLVGIQVDLPLRNRHQGAIAAARAEIRASESVAAGVELRVRGEIAAAYAEYSARRRLIGDTLSPMRERAEQVAQIVRTAYREGGMDLLRVIDAERARIDALVAYFRALTDYQLKVTTLRMALGEMP